MSQKNLYTLQDNHYFMEKKMKIIQFQLPEELYWEIKKYWIVFRAENWEQFFESVLKVLKKVGEEQLVVISKNER